MSKVFLSFKRKIHHGGEKKGGIARGTSRGRWRKEVRILPLARMNNGMTRTPTVSGCVSCVMVEGFVYDHSFDMSCFMVLNTLFDFV